MLRGAHSLREGISAIDGLQVMGRDVTMVSPIPGLELSASDFIKVQDVELKLPLPDPLKAPPFFSQWVKLQNFFETRAEREKPLFRADQGNDSKT